jgi:hypothetical protein
MTVELSDISVKYSDGKNKKLTYEHDDQQGRDN